jgi:hypothetical protein
VALKGKCETCNSGVANSVVTNVGQLRGCVWFGL